MRPTATYDNDLLFKDAGAVTASAAAQVDSAAKIVDIGTGFFEADMIVDVTAIEIASNTEVYTIEVQLSNSATFASGILTAAALSLGANEVITGDTDSTTGRYVIPFRNEYDGTIYRYARVYTVVAGDIDTGINFTAFAAKK